MCELSRKIDMETELVQDWMTPNPITVTSQTTLMQAIRLMEHESVHHLPVVDDGELVGIITEHDIDRMFTPGDNGGT
jgi:CBS domain-containing protein